MNTALLFLWFSIAIHYLHSVKWCKPSGTCCNTAVFRIFPSRCFHVFNNNNLLTAIGLSPGGSGCFTCIQNINLVANKFKSEGLHEKHVVATWNLGNHLSICL